MTTNRIDWQPYRVDLYHTLLSSPIFLISYIHVHYIYIYSSSSSGCGKRGAHINWSMVIPEPVVTGITLRATTDPVPADSRRQ